MIEKAASITSIADILLIVGTSLVVYPAAGLVQYSPPNTPIFVVDPNKPSVNYKNNVTYFTENATTGMQKLKNILIEKHK